MSSELVMIELHIAYHMPPYLLAMPLLLQLWANKCMGQLGSPYFSLALIVVYKLLGLLQNQAFWLAYVGKNTGKAIHCVFCFVFVVNICVPLYGKTTTFLLQSIKSFSVKEPHNLSPEHSWAQIGLFVDMKIYNSLRYSLSTYFCFHPLLER